MSHTPTSTVSGPPPLQRGTLGWLRQNLQEHGGLHSPVETITRAAGSAPSPAPLMQYLEEKFTGLYDL